MWPLLGGLISGGLNLFGGLMGQSNQASINAQNVAAQEAINSQNIANAQLMNNQNIAQANNTNQFNLQAAEDFATHGIQWRVDDAKAAGINPYAALGASTPSAPVAVGATSSMPTLTAPHADASNAFGTGVAAMGQDISRALAATRSPEEQAVAIEKTRQDLESGQLDNELKRAQLASNLTRLGSAQVGPGINKVHPEFQAVRMPDGSIQMFPSRDIEGAAWIDPMAKAQYANRDQLLPAFGFNLPADAPRAPSGQHTYRNPVTGNYYNMRSWGDALASGPHTGVAPSSWSDIWSTIKGLYGQ